MVNYHLLSNAWWWWATQRYSSAVPLDTWWSTTHKYASTTRLGVGGAVPTDFSSGGQPATFYTFTITFDTWWLPTRRILLYAFRCLMVSYPIIPVYHPKRFPVWNLPLSTFLPPLSVPNGHPLISTPISCPSNPDNHPSTNTPLSHRSHSTPCTQLLASHGARCSFTHSYVPTTRFALISFILLLFVNLLFFSFSSSLLLCAEQNGGRGGDVGC